MEDIRLMIGDVKFSARAVAVIQKKGKILFQKKKMMSFGLYLEELLLHLKEVKMLLLEKFMKKQVKKILM